MSKYKIEFRHRPNCKEPIEKKHKRFLEGIADLESPWDLQNIGPLGEIGSELLLIKELDELLGKNIKGRIQYALRDKKYLKDEAMYDDSIIIEIDNKKFVFDRELEKIFLTLVNSFQCYKATIHNVEITRKDWPKIVEAHKNTKKDVNGRDGVFRINAVNYFDKELCIRAFGLKPSKLVIKLEGKVESVYEYCNGLVLVYKYGYLDKNELLSIDTKVRGYLLK